MKFFFKNHYNAYLQYIPAFAVMALVCGVMTVAANTTIGPSISTDGTLQVSSTSTFAGHAAFGLTALPDQNDPLGATSEAIITGAEEMQVLSGSSIYSGLSLFPSAAVQGGSIASPLVGFYSAPLIAPASTADYATVEGGKISVVNQGTGTIASANGLEVGVKNAGSGDITETNGILINAPTNSGGGSVHTNYGVHIKNPDTLNANSYGVYQEGESSLNQFEGSMIVGSSTATEGDIFTVDSGGWATTSVTVGDIITHSVGCLQLAGIDGQWHQLYFNAVGNMATGTGPCVTHAE